MKDYLKVLGDTFIPPYAEIFDVLAGGLRVNSQVINFSISAALFVCFKKFLLTVVLIILI